MYWSQIFGGALIGAAAVAMFALHGRIAGISGFLSRVVIPDSVWRERLAFILGLVAVPLLFGPLPIARPSPASLGALAVAGLLVGVGTVVGNGCTSGHGVCGVARLSKRSMVATATFMMSAIATVFAARHLQWW